ncbi:hypothetical protein [Aeromicrobium sp. UC242_57]|uniref:hypothetical protein n=1 Tax=Aeromicrobium sp. UC242_57 TaxID=3374624 RepID=UPI00379CC450
MITLSWPQLAWLPLGGVLIGLVPSFLTPPPEPPYAAFDAESFETVEEQIA